MAELSVNKMEIPQVLEIHMRNKIKKEACKLILGLFWERLSILILSRSLGFNDHVATKDETLRLHEVRS